MVDIYTKTIDKDISINNKSELGDNVIFAYNRKKNVDIVRDYYDGNLTKVKSSVGNAAFKELEKMGKISQIKMAKHFKVLSA